MSEAASVSILSLGSCSLGALNEFALSEVKKYTEREDIEISNDHFQNCGLTHYQMLLKLPVVKDFFFFYIIHSQMILIKHTKKMNYQKNQNKTPTS